MSRKLIDKQIISDRVVQFYVIITKRKEEVTVKHFINKGEDF